MFALIKKDSLVYGPFLYAVLVLFVIGMTLIDLPAIFTMVVGVSAVALSPFTYDEKSKTNRFLTSMPVNLQTIVTSRYLYSLFVLLGVLVLQWVVLILAKETTIFAPTVYHLYDYLLFFCIGLVLIALFYPILYLFKNSYLGMAVILVLMIVGTFFTIGLLVNILGMSDEFLLNGIDRGFAIFVKTYIPFQPYLVTFVVAALMFVGSIKLSGTILSKKDL